LYIATWRYKEAEAHFQRSLAILEKAELSDERLTMQTLQGLAMTYINEHDETRAEPLLARAEVNGKLIHESESAAIAKPAGRPQIEAVRPVNVVGE